MQAPGTRDGHTNEGLPPRTRKSTNTAPEDNRNRVLILVNTGQDDRTGSWTAARSSVMYGQAIYKLLDSKSDNVSQKRKEIYNNLHNVASSIKSIHKHRSGGNQAAAALACDVWRNYLEKSPK